jgi:glycosyltransferase involved in cell wall biosynthesis
LSLVHSPEAVRRISALIEREKPDLLHCHNIYHQLTPSIMVAAKRQGVRVVLTLHDYKVICPVYTRLRGDQVCTECEHGDFFNVVRHRCADGSLGRSALLYAEAVAQQWMGSYACVDRVIAPSRFMAEAVSRWRFPPEKVALLYNGVDTARFSPKHGDQGYFLFLGRLSKEKGLLTLAKAQKDSGVRVVIAGTGPLETTLRHDYPGLEMVGHLSGEALRARIDGAAGIVVPSEWHENCPMSVLEAMAAGKPVIGSRMGGIPELVADGETGLLFDAGNPENLRQCMVGLLADRDRLAAMGRKGRESAEKNFTLAHHNAGLLKIYESII